MPADKDLKRLARARMKKTGESYTTARAQLIRRKSAARTDAEPATPSARSRPPAREAGVDHAAIAGMSDDAVKAKTGRAWKQWTAVLDAVDAASWEHRRIAEYLSTEHDVPAWWAQMVTVGYERIRGLRQAGQRRDGTHEAGKSRTFNVPIATLYRAWRDARRRRKWLHDLDFTVRKATPEKSVRLRIADGTNVEFYFQARGRAKSTLSIQHRGLASKAAANAMKALWHDRLDALAGVLD